jgi:hypothetical protein
VRTANDRWWAAVGVRNPQHSASRFDWARPRTIRTHYDRSRQPLEQPPPAPAPNSGEAFDPAELIEDFEHPICQFCMGIGHVRDENGINMVRCDYCEGAGRAPAPE